METTNRPQSSDNELAPLLTADVHEQYNRKCRLCGITIYARVKHWAVNGGADGFECWQCPVSCPECRATTVSDAPLPDGTTQYACARCHYVWRIPEPPRPAPTPGAPLAAPAVTGSHQHVCPRCFSHGVHTPEGPCAIPESTLCSWCAPWPAPDPQTHAEREAAQRADEAELQAGLLATLPPMAGGAPTCFYCEHHGDGVVPATRQITFVDNDAPRAEWVCDACARAYFPDAQLAPPPMAGGSGEDTLHPDCSPDDPEVRLIICPECGQMEWWTEQECQDHGKCRADSGPCPVCLPPMAGGAPSHYDDPAWYADEAWHLQEERNAESARTYRCPACAHSYPTDDAMMACFDSHVPEHPHCCPTCHQARPCTGTGCADGPRECNTCSNCRGW